MGGGTPPHQTHVPHTRIKKILSPPMPKTVRPTLGGWMGVGGFMTIMPHCGSILQAGTYQILSLAENPRWNQVWK